MFKLIIDIREHDLIKELESAIEFDVKPLDVGDIQIFMDESPCVVIERKTIADMAASIKDGRYKEQKVRLKSFRGANPNIRIAYLLEGKLSNSKTAKTGGMLHSTIKTSMLGMNIRDEFSTIQTTNVADTANTILKLMKKMPSYKDDLRGKMYSIDDYTDCIRVQKKDNITVDNCFRAQIMQINGVSSTLSKAICSHFKSIVDMSIKMSKWGKDKSIVALSEIRVSEKRKVGKAIATKLVKFMGVSDKRVLFKRQ